MSRKCMVTGSAGFIGSALARRLLQDRWDVVGVDCFTDSYDPVEKLARAGELCQNPRYSHIAEDLVDLGTASVLDGVEVVFHLAGRPGVRDSFSQLERYRHDNVAATRQIVDASKRAGSVRRLVYASSSSVYGDAPLPFAEDGATVPISPYGETKLEAEQICLGASARGSGASVVGSGELSGRLETVALRYFTVYGPGQRPDMALRRFAEAALARRPLVLYGDGAQSRDFTYVDDVVEATVAAADAPADGLAVNVGGGSRVTLTEVFELLADLVGVPVAVERQAFANGDVRHTGADLARARSLLGFEAKVSLREGLDAEVGWLRDRAIDHRRPA